MSQSIATEVKHLRMMVWGLAGVVALLVALLLMGAAERPAQELTVRKITVVDDDGVVRAVLAGRVPDPTSGPRVAPGGGLIIYGPDGKERGGYMTSDMSGEAVLTLDDALEREVFKVTANPDAGASLFLPHQSGAAIAMTTYRGEPEIHFFGPDQQPRLALPEGTPPLR